MQPAPFAEYKRLLCLLVGGALLLLGPDSAESFQSLERASSFSIPKAYFAFSTRWKDASTMTPSSKTSSTTSLFAQYYFTTALEGLWEDRLAGMERKAYKYLEWMDLDSDPNIGKHKDDSDASSDAFTNKVEPNSTADSSVTLPLYPLNEVYLPMTTTSQAPDEIVTHTLYNVEPQNVKMALDLFSEASSSPCFCAVLRAMDTGRIATVGNLLRIVDAEFHTDYGKYTYIEYNNTTFEEKGEIVRIQLTCQSEGLAEILGVENGKGWKEKRLLGSNEYLKARLRPVTEVTDEEQNIEGQASSDWEDAYHKIREDLRIIKLIYQLEVGSQDYPPSWLRALGNGMQEFPYLDDFDGPNKGDVLLWRLAQEWQSVCTTLREGRKAFLDADRNELLVTAARERFGYISLPIDISELYPESRRALEQLDQEIQEEHETSGMDPVLDFQVLLGLPTRKQRFKFLAKLVARERRRLQDISALYQDRRDRREFD